MIPDELTPSTPHDPGGLAGASPGGSILIRTGQGRLAENFAAEELACGCDRGSCKAVVVHWCLIRLLSRIRKQIGQPLYVTSGYRCPRHNRDVGGAPESLHLAGMAADVQASIEPRHLAAIAKACGAGGIGVYPRHVHVDVGEPGRRWEGDYEDNAHPATGDPAHRSDDVATER
jgi:hypothetical protein